MIQHHLQRWILDDEVNIQVPEQVLMAMNSQQVSSLKPLQIISFTKVSGASPTSPLFCTLAFSYAEAEPCVEWPWNAYLTTVHYSYGRGLATCNADHHLRLQTVGNLAGSGLVCRGAWPNLSTVVIAPGIHLATRKEDEKTSWEHTPNFFQNKNNAWTALSWLSPFTFLIFFTLELFQF